ncbi:hypothetical protein MUN84_02715 [Hymenobacter sp. 5516J-16]|uniref:hypothetical protein n=1 Tax=Hymenobacter sp. 5516J-16 TaxID=2932253 RepID=UPI001FD48785|nr:hypothetical protein [Hymenobacter sp. 5516J-16]UOQ77619.1 hypothetical protein MUN84_02715 [Hymenobacter sp. 5516J-16]
MMQRVQAADPAGPLAWGWLAALTGPVRTALASGVVLGGFAACFWLSSAPSAPVAATDSLARVPRHEMVQYLLASDQRVSLTDLAELPAATPEVPAEEYLHASPAEVQDVLDAQPTEDIYL